MSNLAKTHYLEKKLLNHTLRGVAYSAPAGAYAALFTAAPTDQGGGTEVTGGAYERQGITFGAATDNGSSEGSQVANSVDIEFPQATADWGEVTDIAIFDAATSGNMLYHGPLDDSRTILENDQFTILTGDLVVEEH